jgi:hypothetical protein
MEQREAELRAEMEQQEAEHRAEMEQRETHLRLEHDLVTEEHKKELAEMSAHYESVIVERDVEMSAQHMEAKKNDAIMKMRLARKGSIFRRTTSPVSAHYFSRICGLMESICGTTPGNDQIIEVVTAL